MPYLLKSNIAEERQQRVARFGQAHNAAVVKLHGCVYRIGAKRIGITQSHSLALLGGLLHLGTVGVIVHGAGIGRAVEQHRAVRSDERIACQTAELGFERGCVLGRRCGVQVACGVLGARSQLRLGIALVGHIVYGGHRHGQ